MKDTNVPVERKEWTGKSIEAVFRTQEGFEKVMNVPEFRWSWVIPIRRPLRFTRVFEFGKVGPEPIEEMETGLDRKEFFFDKWLDDSKTKALYLAK